MEVNKEEAERCRDMGAGALKKGQHARAVKLLKKSMGMYPLPGVEALLGQAERMAKEAENGSASASRPAAAASRPQTARSASTASAASSATSGADGRAYTAEQVKIVKEILHAKEGGRGAHYRVLGIAASANENEIKKAYRKRALKLHPDKNSAPHADEAFKAVGLAYATLSDAQKRTIYDRYGDEDPDNRGGGGARGPGGMHFRRGEEVNPEDIFNMFFGGGGMPGGARGFHFNANGFGGPGVQFGGGRQPRARQGGGGAARQPAPEANGIGALVQFLPILLILMLSFLNFGGDSGQSYTQNRYFSLTQTAPYVNPLQTKLTTVKDIPYFVTNKFMKSYYRDRYQLAQVERLVEKTYAQYLVDECKQQKAYKRQLENQAKRMPASDAKERSLRKAAEFELSRCDEYNDLFPTNAKQQYRGY